MTHRQPFSELLEARTPAEALSINAALSSNVSGNLQFAVKSHGREIEPKFSELAKYEIIQGTQSLF